MAAHTRRNDSAGADPGTTIMSALLPIHTAVGTEWLVDAAATAAERVLNAAFAFVFFEDQEGRLEHRAPASDLRRRSQQRVYDAFARDLFRRKLDLSQLPAFAEALDTGQAVQGSLETALGPLAEAGRADAAAATLGTGTACIAPMETAGERIGALLTLTNGEIEPDRARLLAEHIAVAAVNLRQTNAAREQGVIDVVRSVFDARKLESELQRELARAMRYKREVSIVVVEATNLRLLREQFGRFLTERLLQRLGEVLASQAREIDVIGAYRESGYTMILTEAGGEHAPIARQRLLAVAENVRLEGENVPGLELHVLAGHATFPGDGETTETLFEAVERRMYGDAAAHVA
jgi:diguanylate cyclase (GGDEF)-like protein